MTFGENLEAIFNASFGTQQQEALVRCLFDAYKISYNSCYRESEYHYHEAHDLLPFLRWVNLRKLIRGIGDRFKGIETSSKPNGPASSFHIRVSTDSVMLTVSSSENKWSLPRPASHRKEYANQNRQLKLEFTGEENKPRNSKVYAILTHGANQNNKKLPGFARIMFPSDNYKSSVHRIDLFEKYSDLIKLLSGDHEFTEGRREPIRKDLEPKIKREAV